ncbi:MAG TPA: transposase [Armatimonadota bacterium]|nr:transposase [Armatimonadota bacterium]
MTSDGTQLHRRSIRLPTYDYSQPGGYFVTICTHERKCVFGAIAASEVQLNDRGRIVAEEWVRSSGIRREIELDAWVVMPNHIHGIILICGDGLDDSPQRHGNDVGAHGRAPLQRKPRSLASFVAGFKCAATKRINELRSTPGRRVWQRNYYEHVIRNADDLAEIRRYIADNPLKWESDTENPVNERRSRQGKACLAPTCRCPSLATRILPP